MSHITSIFERADIQHIREFLLNGEEALQINHATYEQRLADSMNEVIKMVDTYFPDSSEQIIANFFNAVTVHEEVYMEIGLELGIELALQMFNIKI